jgi:hypothetical protein
MVLQPTKDDPGEEDAGQGPNGSSNMQELCALLCATACGLAQSPGMARLHLLQALLALGVLGGTFVAVSHPEAPLPLFVATHPWAVWLVGPSFAALTGGWAGRRLQHADPRT